MASSTKPATSLTARRKSTKGSLIVTLKLSPAALRTFAPTPDPIKEESPSKDSLSAPSTTQPAPNSSNGDNPSESNPNTPGPVGTPGSSSMPPPSDLVKKRGIKRGPAAPLDPNAPPKVRGKPGPKKKARLEDGSIDHSAPAPRAANGTAAHKLGPKANQGAINAGLRALDRSGKPCRKWQKGGFTMKSFTGVVWELPRWKAPPRATVGTPDEQLTSDNSSKENKDNSQMESVKSEKSNSGPDVEIGSNASQNVSSPAPSLPSVPTTVSTTIVTASA